jgi:hypothetical protein
MLSNWQEPSKRGGRLDVELGLYQEGTARKWMRHDLDAVLKPYIRE